MSTHVLVGPADSLEADCVAASLRAAGVCTTTVPTDDVDAVLLLVTPGGAPDGAAGFDDDRERPLLLLGSTSDPSTARVARRLGAAGVVDWSVPTDTLLEALGRITAGAAWSSGEATAGVDPLGDLTGRELDVVRLMGQGATNEAISRALGISYHTVRTHVAHVLAKLGVSHRYAVVSVMRISDRPAPVLAGSGRA
ncbi:helix-turn-helix transcriptional regulator [Nocardioides sp. GXQ0305]|uniref:helix-turn-helix transcriptional regulator n=1 Tax=Nocardioides sp. GXQ0305 TaxID=3423912 RepID=UPI003D7C887A